MSLNRFVLILIFFEFFTPAYSLFESSSIFYIFLPDLKHYITFLLSFSYLFFAFISSANLKIKKDSLFIYLLFFTIYFIVSYIFLSTSFDTYTYVDPFSISSLTTCLALYVAFFRKANYNYIFNQFIKVLNIIIVFMFIELLSTFIIENPYSFSSFNKSFISIIIQDLNTVSILCNFVFGISFCEIIIFKRNRFKNFLLIIISLIICYFTYSRTALLLNIIIYAFIYFSHNGFGKALYSLISLFFLLLIINFFQPLLETTNSQKTDLTELSSLYLRVVLLYVGFKVLFSNLLFGIGPFLIHEKMWNVIKNTGNDNFFDSILLTANNTTLVDGIWITKPHFAFMNLIIHFGIIAIFFYLKIFKILLSSFKSRSLNTNIIFPIITLFIILAHNSMYPQLNLIYVVFFVLVLKYFKASNQTYLNENN